MAKLFPLLVTLIFLLLPAASAQSVGVPAQFIEFIYNSGKKDLFDYTNYLRNLERRSSRLIRAPRQQLRLKITAISDFPEGFKAGDAPDTYLLSDKLERLYFDYALNMKLIETVLLARSGIRPDELRTPHPLWLATAIYRKIRPEPDGYIPVPKRPGLRALAGAGEFPQVETALLNPISFTRDGPAAYFLFEELCELVLDFSETVSGVSGDYYRMMQLCRSGAAPAEIMADTLRKRFATKLETGAGLNDSEKMQAVLDAYARNRLVNQHHPYTAEQTAEHLRELLTFKYELTEADKTVIRQARLERLPYILPVAANREKLIRELTDRLNEITGKSFYLVAEELTAVGRIIVDAGLGTVASPQTLGGQLQRRLNNLEKALERQRLIEQRLRDLEIRHIPPVDYYKNEFQEIRSFRPIFPEAEQLLDKYEKELREFH